MVRYLNCYSESISSRFNNSRDILMRLFAQILEEVYNKEEEVPEKGNNMNYEILLYIFLFCMSLILGSYILCGG